ncbi:unnamed protein product [Effrenium voratum]|nr:unnamed protein product [Effrenium voratum]
MHPFSTTSARMAARTTTRPEAAARSSKWAWGCCRPTGSKGPSIEERNPSHPRWTNLPVIAMCGQRAMPWATTQGRSSRTTRMPKLTHQLAGDFSTACTLTFSCGSRARRLPPSNGSIAAAQRAVDLAGMGRCNGVFQLAKTQQRPQCWNLVLLMNQIAAEPPRNSAKDLQCHPILMAAPDVAHAMSLSPPKSARAKVTGHGSSM